MSSGAHARVRDQDANDPCLQAPLLEDGLREGESWAPREVSAEEAIAMAGAWGTFQRRQTIALSLAMGYGTMHFWGYMLSVFGGLGWNKHVSLSVHRDREYKSNRNPEAGMKEHKE